MFNLIEVTEQDLASSRNSQGNELVKAFKGFLNSEDFKKLPKGSIKGIAVESLLTGVKEAHYYALKLANTAMFSKGKSKGKVNPNYDKELSQQVAIAFPVKFKTENAKITAFAFKKL